MGGRKELKQVRCGKDVNKGRSGGDKGEGGKMPLEESPRLPERGRKIGKEMIIRPSNRILSTDIRSITLHSVRLDISRRTAVEPRTQSKIH